MRFSVYQESRIGGRKTNQDRMGYSFTRDALLLLLADGMGGHIQGEVASVRQDLGASDRATVVIGAFLLAALALALSVATAAASRG